MPRAAVAIAVLVVLCGLVLLVRGLSGAEVARLDRSVMGNAGLRGWLQAHDVPSRLANPRLAPPASEFSIAVMPLFDTDLLRGAERPEDADARMLWTDPRDVQAWELREMTAALPSLIVLPKWRFGFAMTGIAHAETQLPPGTIATLMGQLPLAGTRLMPVENTLTEARIAPYPGAPEVEVALFRAQLFDRARLPFHCREMAGTPRGALLLACADHRGMAAAHYLSDPDLMNNHGLSLAGNADWALGLVAALRGGDARPVYLALAPAPPGYDEQHRQPHERTAEDLSRFFAWPLSVLWAVATVVLGLTAWRGLARFGPARGGPATTRENSRLAAITAKARLLRLAGADQRIVAEHARALLAQMAGQALGPAHATEAGIARWFQLLARRDPALAAALQKAADRLAMPDPISPHDLTRRLEAFRDLTRKASDAA